MESVCCFWRAPASETPSRPSDVAGLIWLGHEIHESRRTISFLDSLWPVVRNAAPSASRVNRHWYLTHRSSNGLRLFGCGRRMRVDLMLFRSVNAKTCRSATPLHRPEANHAAAGKGNELRTIMQQANKMMNFKHCRHQTSPLTLSKLYIVTVIEDFFQ